MTEYGQDVEFHFIQTMPMEEKRKSMGWGVDESKLSFVTLFYREEERARELILKSDVVLFGWTEGIASDLRNRRFSSGKLSFTVSERIYREGQWKVISPKGLLNKYKEHLQYRNYPVYLLCTGAYVASDFSLIRSYPGKMLKWGYFPEVSCARGRQERKVSDALRLCWAGRLIELKHPEYAIRLAAFLKASGYSFTLDIVGDGPLRGMLEETVKEKELGQQVNFAGSKAPSEVIGYMERADIFLFTSNYLEGWGAVVNEAMSCGCAVVASKEAGAVPFLIKDMENGLIYDNGSYEELEKKVSYLFENKEEIAKLGKRAEETIDELWNADNAAKELIRFCKESLEGKTPRPAEKGPMSAAKVIKAPGFSRTLKEKNRLE